LAGGIRRFALCGCFCGFGMTAAVLAAEETTTPAKPAATPEEPAAAPASIKAPAEGPAMAAADEAAEEAAAAPALEEAAVARAVTPDPVRVYGWRERIKINGIDHVMNAKLDTGALTSSIHAEEKELFERDGKKWVRFIVRIPVSGEDGPARARLEAPLVRIARIKEPGGDSHQREVVRLSFQIGERKMRGDFTLNDRSNMLNPVLIGRNTIKELGWVDSGRTYLAEENILR